MRFFALGFFHESSSPKPLKITLGSFQTFFKKCAEIFTSQGPPPVPIHRRQILQPVPLVLLKPVANMPSESTIPATSLPLDAAGVNDTGGK